MLTSRRSLCGTLFLAFLFATGALAQYQQQGPKLVGAGSEYEPFQGSVLALSADGNTAIVGGERAQGAWIFTRNAGVWTQQGGKLTGSDVEGGFGALQGWSVAISADGNTAVIGGYLDHDSTGAVWVFTRNAGVWTQQGNKLVGAGAVGHAYQGNSVALSGDGNTLAIGGPVDNYPRGAVWIFTRAAGVWTQQGSKLTASDAAPPDLLGQRVSLSDDGNVLIAAGDGTRTATVRTFLRTGGTWRQAADPQPGPTSIESAPGAAIAVSGDGNTAIVGGFDSASQDGAAWIYVRNGDRWTQQARLYGWGTAGFNVRQGSSVALSRDGNTAVLGGPGDNQKRGAAWVFTRSNGAWSQPYDKLTGAGSSGPSVQGSAVDISADASTILIGGPWDDTDRGAVWVFTAPAPTAPAAGSVAPASGSGADQTFIFTFSDTGGWQNLTVVNVLIGDRLDAANACYLAFTPSGPGSGTLFLDDYGSVGTRMTLPGSGTLTNRQCSVTASAIALSTAGNQLSLRLTIAFTPAFSGNKVIYLAARNGLRNSGWQALGTWNVPGAPSSGPAVSGMTPAHSSGFNATYTFTFTDPKGWQDLSVLNILIGSSLDARRACYIAYVPVGLGAGNLFLVDDAGDVAGPYSNVRFPPSPGNEVASNNQCAVFGGSVRSFGSGNTLQVTLTFLFTAGFTGNQIIYAAARTNSESSGWQAVGTVSVADSLAPVITSVEPSSSPASHSVRLKVTGTGFLNEAICPAACGIRCPGGSRVVFDSGTVTAEFVSPTELRAEVPVIVTFPPRTVNVSVITEVDIQCEGSEVHLSGKLPFTLTP